MIHIIKKDNAYIAVFENITSKERDVINQIVLMEKEQNEKPLHQITIDEALVQEAEQMKEEAAEYEELEKKQQEETAAENEEATEAKKEKKSRNHFVFVRREPKPVLQQNNTADKAVHKAADKAADNANDNAVNADKEVVEKKEEQKIKPFVFQRREPKAEPETTAKETVSLKSEETTEVKVREAGHETDQGTVKVEVQNNEPASESENTFDDHTADEDYELPDWCTNALNAIYAPNDPKEKSSDDQHEQAGETQTESNESVSRKALNPVTMKGTRELCFVGKQNIMPQAVRDKLDDEVLDYKECPFMSEDDKREVLHERYHFDYDENCFEEERR